MKITLRYFTSLRIFVVTQAILVLISFVSEAKILPPVYVCPEEEHSTFINNDIKVGTGDVSCSSGTDMRIIILLSISDKGVLTDLGTASVTRLDGRAQGGHRAQVDIDWIPGVKGVMIVRVEYERHLQHWNGCRSTGWSEMYTYEIHRDVLNISPGGILTGSITSSVPDNQTLSTFSLTYAPTTSEFLSSPPQYIATRVRYFNGRDAIEVDQPITDPILYYAVAKKDYELQTEIFVEKIDDLGNPTCGTWRPGPSQTLTVRSSCFLDDVSGVTITPTGVDVISYLDESPPSFNLKSNATYTLDVKGITDFSTNYTWDFSDFGVDMQSNGNSFTIPSSLQVGSYRIIVKAIASGCPTPKDIPILVGNNATNLKLKQKCTISLPQDISQFYADMLPTDLIIKHFAGFVQTERSIIIEPGVTLELGAELFLDYPDPAPDPEDIDKKMNFTEQTSYDEYGRVLGSSRSYFDERGTSLQNQAKSLSAGAILASATLYDAFGRPAISTLSAPVAMSTIVPTECPDDSQEGAKIRFAYKPDFVKANGEIYAAKHFDIIDASHSNEMTPIAVDASEENTLGWYYSANNTKEPLVATTQYPYSRKLYKHDGSGGVKGVTKPGDAFKAGSNFLATSDQEPVLTNDLYFSTDNRSYLSIRKNELGFDRPLSIEGEFFKNVSIDESGKKSVMYADKSGKTIIALYYGDQSSPITTSYQFYDKAGRLLTRISPNGMEQYVREDATGKSNFDSIDKTTYFYNNKGLIKAVEEKIAGQAANGISRTEYMYRKDGRIRFSQNQEQRNASPQRYSFTNYDNSGRPIESGEYVTSTISIVFNSLEMKSILENTNDDGGLVEMTGIKKHRTFTLYDEPNANIPASSAALQNRIQRFVYGAVSRTKKVEYNRHSLQMEDKITTWYSYDERGRVEWVVQYIVGLGVKTIDYRYGPTCQVQDVTYQKDVINTSDPSKTEQFVHFYEYDADGRLEKVYTSREYLVYDKLGKLINTGVTYNDKGKIDNPGALELQATYFYYLHGPLKRMELAKKLQGIDYVYTADGTLKGINNADPITTKDPGQDGNNNGFRPDVFGMSLDYFTKDYVGANGAQDAITTSSVEDQHSGLIKAMRWHSPIEPSKQFSYVYKYDSRNQFKQADWGTVNENIFTKDALNSYHEEVKGYDASGNETEGYDANGNIRQLRRNANEGLPLANFSYNYKTYTNMLQSIGQGSETFRDYAYNDLGQMTRETEGDKTKFVIYDVTGKVTGIYADTEHNLPITTFTYDDIGFRLSKTSYDATNKPVLCTWYVRDASGNVVSTYEQPLLNSQTDQTDQSDQTIRIVEIPVYGISRMGMYKPESGVTLYELSDHLGNVRAVIGDKFEAEYMATMESERADKETNDGFIVKRSGLAIFNHTPSAIVVDKVHEDISSPDQLNRINNRPNGQFNPDPIGTAIMLPVHPGDVISADVFAKYVDFDDTKFDPLTNLAGFLNSAITGRAIIDGAAFNVVNSSEFASASVWAKLKDDQPRAFLNYLLFDNNLKLQKFDFAQVSSDAEVPEVSPELKVHEHLMIENITIEKEGFIYIYVSNESNQNLEVYFDDLRIRHTYSDIVAGGDFYPYGLAIKDRQINRDLYRHGYQGQFAEKDDETGWSHFELREYDAVIGRWTATDPKGQYWSPYIGMGNDPINSVDPDGGEGGPARKKPPIFGDAEILNEVTVTGKKWSKADETNFQNSQSPSIFNNFNSNVAKWDKESNDFGRWLEKVMPKPKAGLAYFADDENGVGPIVKTRDGHVDGYVTNPGDLPVFGRGFSSPKTKLTVLVEVIVFGKDVHEGIDKVHKVVDQSPSIKQVHAYVIDSTMSIMETMLESDKSKSLRTTTYKNSVKYDTLKRDIWGN